MYLATSIDNSDAKCVASQNVEAKMIWISWHEDEHGMCRDYESTLNAYGRGTLELSTRRCRSASVISKDVGTLFNNPARAYEGQYITSMPTMWIDRCGKPNVEKQKN
ncbi:hypothetical protein Tco_0916074 [Tanacetum coccineum]